VNSGRPFGARRAFVLTTYEGADVLDLIREHRMVSSRQRPREVMFQHSEESVFPLDAVKREDARTASFQQQQSRVAYRCSDIHDANWVPEGVACKRHELDLWSIVVGVPSNGNRIWIRKIDGGRTAMKCGGNFSITPTTYCESLSFTPDRSASRPP
jgi:hypothetical protein